MGFIDKRELDVRLSADHNLAERLKLSPEVPASRTAPFDESKFKTTGETRSKPLFNDEMRAIIGATTVLTSPKQASEVFDVAPSYAAALARGDYSRTSDLLKREEDNGKLRDAIYDELKTIREAARDKLALVLGLISEDNLEKIPDKDRARLAAQMANQLSSVVDRTIQKSSNLTDARTAHLHLYRPEQREIGQFNIVNVNDQVPQDNMGPELNTIDVGNGINGQGQG